MQTIEIDFDVFKELTMRRKNEEVAYNDVLRELLNLEEKEKNTIADVQDQQKSWLSKGVLFPHGTEFRTIHKNIYIYGKVENSALVVNGKRFPSPSSAAKEVTGTSVNGWKYWECKLPGQTHWILIDEYRK